MAAGLSCDQMLSEVVGVWGRAAIQDDAAAVRWQRMLAGGVELNASMWDRPGDVIGLGYAHLCDGNIGIDSTDVFEGYVRVFITEMIYGSLHAQYMCDSYTGGGGVDGWVLGGRIVLEW